MAPVAGWKIIVRRQEAMTSHLQWQELVVATAVEGQHFETSTVVSGAGLGEYHPGISREEGIRAAT